MSRMKFYFDYAMARNPTIKSGILHVKESGTPVTMDWSPYLLECRVGIFPVH